MRRAAGAAVAAALLLSACQPTADEPRLTVLCSNEAEICEAWASTFAEREGVAVRSVRLPSAEASTRIQDAPAGEYDVWHGGPAELYEQAADRDLLVAYEPSGADAIPAELRDPDHRWTGVYASMLALCANRGALDRLGTSVPETWDDVLDPALRGWVSAPSPLASGTAYTTMALHVDRLGDEEGRAYLEELYGQVMQFTRSGPAVANVVAEGEAAVGVTFAPYCDRRADRGDDVVVAYPADGTAYELGAVAIVAGTADRSLAERYVDVATSAIGQAAGASTGIAQTPTRTDMPGDLSSVLEGTPLVVVESSVAERSSERDELLGWFRDRVGAGA